MTFPFLSRTARVLYILSLRTCTQETVMTRHNGASLKDFKGSATYCRCIAMFLATFPLWSFAGSARVVGVLRFPTINSLSLCFAHACCNRYCATQMPTNSPAQALQHSSRQTFVAVLAAANLTQGTHLLSHRHCRTSSSRIRAR